MTISVEPVHKSLRYFDHLAAAGIERLFLNRPAPFSDSDPRERLAYALGATLYVPGTRPDLAATIARRCSDGVRSMVIDLEDAVADDELEAGLAQTVSALDALAGTSAGGMLLFVRTRTARDIGRLIDQLGPGVDALTGFVVPKFTADSEPSLAAVVDASSRVGKHLYVMPVLESPELVHGQTRDIQLRAIAELLNRYRTHVLAARIGATDMCGVYGIRRDRDLTIYDVAVIADAISGIVNYLGRRDDSGFVITGPVWEYFADHERMFRPMLRTTPFAEHDAVRFRQQLVSRDLDGLLREIALDRANGIHGKTVIHPSHVSPVNALSAVTHEEYLDALDITEAKTGGVRASTYGNKMNEAKPHRNWAEQVLIRASVFGVTNPGITFVDLLTELVTPS
ncbi:HpcH/HpaI aldolase/citrate lyase family protein [Gordonia sp. TBRC 11910]|uniref:HpcH/HpaI aldolase/citrate lyase family protein n=1 Tax=Gordonia asplenii TaxID=2725283 RepID=A0A848L327_9ACTN|nr:HpcH/HpaI aldolase/citrate lyase family protein [Gordonia asplenii]NMO03465.1 HpcH/HpaI aldolase/citrate lyase family protein [Gordonia asplenii]